MAYTDTDRRSDLNIKQDDLLASKRFVIERKPDSVFFYELEEAVVLDIILNEDHPEFKNSEINADASEWPAKMDGSPVQVGDKNYGLIGSIKFRFLNSERGKEKEKLTWAFPLENTGITEWPLLNETVIIGKYSDRYYYSRKLNTRSVTNSNANFITEKVSGIIDGNINEYTGDPFDGVTSKLTPEGGEDYEGVLGKYFKFNYKIRGIKRYEGDTILESRFGSSIRFGAYDSVRQNDNGLNDYEDGGGNPKILIRNRQAPITKKPATNPKAYTEEDINQDGSSVHMTSGKTISKFETTCDKVMFSKSIQEEQPAFSPEGGTEFDFPTLDGDQIVINSDRLIFSSKANETFHFSKKRLSMVTDDEFTIDAHKQIVVTTNEVTSINSPMIFLGEAYQMAEPALLGRTTTFWNITLCNWLLNQTNWMIELCNEWLVNHVHDDDSHKDMQKPPKSSWVSKMKDHVKALEKLRDELISLRDEAPKNMSQRVFLVGGGGAPGFPGGELITKEPMDNNQEKESPSDAMDKAKKKYELVRVESNAF